MNRPMEMNDEGGSEVETKRVRGLRPGQTVRKPLKENEVKVRPAYGSNGYELLLRFH